MLDKVIYLSFVTAAVSYTVTEAKAFLPLREWAKRANKFTGRLLSCGYCSGYWVAFALIAIYRPRIFDCWWLFDYFLTAIVVAWFSAFQWILMCLLVQRAGK